MSLLAVKTHDLTCQDHTMNVELMTAPIRSQLLHNKHKGISTKYRQHFNNLERERISFLRTHRNEMRLMERCKEAYAKSKNNILQRRMSSEARQLSRLETELEVKGVFLTNVNIRETQSADKDSSNINTAKHCGSRQNALRAPALHVRSASQHPITEMPQTLTPIPALTPAASSKQGSPQVIPGPPHLRREKSVRFRNIHACADGTSDVDELEDPAEPTEERVKRFIQTQVKFNNRKPEVVRGCRSQSGRSSSDYSSDPQSPSAMRRQEGLIHNMQLLECGFDKLCGDGSKEGFHKLVKYATKMKVYVKAL